MTNEFLTRQEIESHYDEWLVMLTGLLIHQFPELPNSREFAHDVITSLWERAATFRRECNIVSYLSMILKRKALSAVLKRRKHFYLDDESTVLMESTTPSLVVGPNLTGLYRREVLELIDKTKLSAFQRDTARKYLSDCGFNTHREEVEMSRAIKRLRKTVNVCVLKRKYVKRDYANIV